MAVVDRNFKVSKKVNSKKILEDVKKIVENFKIKHPYKLYFKDITQEDSFFKPFYAVGVDIQGKIPEKKRIEIKDTIGEFLRENYGFNIGVSVWTD